MEEKEEVKPKYSAAHLAPYQFKPGVSGNPKGRTPGKSLKEYSREFLAKMTDDERLKFMEGLPKIDIWKMAEGNPEQEVKGNLTISELLDNLKNKNGDTNKGTNGDGGGTDGQGLENESPIQDSEQEQKESNVQEK